MFLKGWERLNSSGLLTLFSTVASWVSGLNVACLRWHQVAYVLHDILHTIDLCSRRTSYQQLVPVYYTFSSAQ